MHAHALQHTLPENERDEGRQCLRVLLVEDDEDDYLLTDDLFERAYGKHYSLNWQSSSAMALAELDSNQFDVCLIDYQLGTSTGIQLIESIIQKGHNHIAIILLTGMDNREVDLQATEAGATDYLVKDQLTPETLERSIRYSRHQKAAEAQVQHLAFHDPLTGLANRTLFANYLERAIGDAHRHGEFGALLFIDLDNFKSINDSLGHGVGDSLLIEVSDRLQGNIRDGDAVARLGGDEFVLLYTRLTGDKQSAYELVFKITEKMREILTSPMQINGHELRVGCSIGVTLFNDKNDSCESLLKQADIAMYRAKSDGKNMVRFFESQMEESVKACYWVEQELPDALDNGNLELFYQPIVELATNRISAAEALIRWRHPDKGLVAPGDFIPTVENSDLICSIGKFVISQACEYLANSAELDYLSVNIGARHFEKQSFSHELTSILDAAGISPRRLVIELTETVLLKNAIQARSKMLELSEIGVRFALDDFGTGYSSLSALKNLPLHILKIDRSFINDIGTDSQSDAITEAIIGMSRILGLTVVAEGVETAAQLAFLVDHDCAYAQGYYFNKPITQQEFTDLVHV